MADEEALEAVSRAVNEYHFCPNRVWALASSYLDKENFLPYLFPCDDIDLRTAFEQHRHRHESMVEHDRCTLDFCEQSQRNYTTLSQRHDSPLCQDHPCKRITNLFAREELNKAALDERSTAWQLSGRKTLSPHQKYLAISHVWSDGTGAGVWLPSEPNRCLYQYFCLMARNLECDGLWWDTLCVPTDKIARAKAINNMHINYSSASCTLVHDCFLRRTSFVNGETACVAILMSPWFSRGWTALELANSQSVKIIFQDNLLVDLDEILANPRSKRHQLAANAISNLRSSRIKDIDHLLRVLTPRFTSWIRDMATISGLLVGVELEPSQGSNIPAPLEEAPQQDVNQAIIRKIGFIRYGHLFHNSPTISNGISWCPARLLTLPPAANSRRLHVDDEGNVIGVWNVSAIECLSSDKYTYEGAHPWVVARLRVGLKHGDEHRFLWEPLSEVNRFLLVKLIRSGSQNDVCQLIGYLRLRQPEALEDIVSTQRTCIIINVSWNPSRKAADSAIPTSTGDAIRVAGAVHNVPDRSGKSRFPNLLLRPSKRIRVPANLQKPTRRSSDELMMAEPIITGLPQYQGVVEPPASTNVPERVWPGKASDFIYKDQANKSLAQDEMSLIEGSQRGDTALVLSMLRNQANILCSDSDGRTCISWAAGNGHVAVLKLLLNYYSSWWSDNSATRSVPLKKYSFSLVEKQLREFEIVCNRMDKDGRTPLTWAAAEGHIDTCKLLLSFPEVCLEPTSPTGWTPLWYAADNDKVEVMQLLLEAGADAEAKDLDNDSLIRRVAGSGSRPMIELLLNYEAQPSNGDIMGTAIDGLNVPAVQVLWERGVAPQSRFGDKGHPLIHAISRRHVDLFRLLVDTYQIDVCRENNEGNFPLACAVDPDGHRLFRSQSGQHWESTQPGVDLTIFHMLLSNPSIHVNQSSKHGTALHVACIIGADRAAEALIGAPGINLNAKDPFEKTPLHVAVDNGQTAIVKLLLSHPGVDIECTTTITTGQTVPSFWDGTREYIEKQMTAEQLAKHNGHDEIFRTLREAISQMRGPSQACVIDPDSIVSNDDNIVGKYSELGITPC